MFNFRVAIRIALRAALGISCLLVHAGVGNATTILAIDFVGNLHEVETSTGSVTTLGATGMPNSLSLDRAPDGSLYSVSGGGSPGFYSIDESGPGSSIEFSQFGPTGEGGLVFTSNTHAFMVGRALATGRLLSSIDLDSKSVSTVGILPPSIDINGLIMRSDGFLIGVERVTNSLLQIDASTAATSEITTLDDMLVNSVGGFVWTSDGAIYANASSDGAVNELWSIDLFTGEHIHLSDVVGIAGISGLATVPEPSTGLLLGAGLVWLARRRRKGAIAPLLAVALFLGNITPQIASASTLYEDLWEIVGDGCTSGEFGETQCAELSACVESPESCNWNAGSAEQLMPSAQSAMTVPQMVQPFGGGGASAPLLGTSISFRGSETFAPRLSPSGLRVAFDETNGPLRVARAIFGDGVAYGTSVPVPTPFNVNTASLGGIDDGGLVVGSINRFTGPDTAFTADGVLGFDFTLTDQFNIRTYDSARGLDVDFDSTRIVGSVFLATALPFGQNFAAIWEFDNDDLIYKLRVFNGLGFGLQGGFTAVTPGGTHAVGLSASPGATSSTGSQAFLYTASGSSFTALPFLPLASANNSESLALSDAVDILVGNATNASGVNVATTWFDVSGSYLAQELPRFPGVSTSRGLAASGDGLSLGGSIGSDAVIWNGLTFEPYHLQNFVSAIGLTVPPECSLSAVTDLDLFGTRIVGEATCNTGGGNYKRVFELETPVPVPEPGAAISMAMGAGFLGLLVRKRQGS